MNLFKKVVAVALLPAVLLGCGDYGSNSDKKENTDEIEIFSPHTGNEVFENEIAPQQVQSPYRSFILGSEKYYVWTSRLNVRSAPDIQSNNIVGALGLNDEVLVVKEIEGTVFVEIQILSTDEEIAPADAYYVSKDYLSTKKNEQRQSENRSRYFMIQNVATEKMRVYEKQCDDGACAHKMILEADIAVGERSDDRATMTVLGSFNVTKWYKFYQDGAGLYPSWYHPDYPPMPGPGESVRQWTKSKVMPRGKGNVRGAFGWYTAHVGPDSRSQWTHGTLGWGSDKTKYIDVTRGFFSNLFTDPRSHGCTRTDNETIAFVRQLIEVGTPIIKVYAIEAMGDPSLSRYPQKSQTWSYILTKNGSRTDGEKADRAEVLARGTSSDRWLEEGVYTVDTYPDAKTFSSGKKGARKSKNGNVYALDKSDMRGVFLIDQGLLVNYAHPSELSTGGYGRNSFPSFVVAKGSPTYVLP